MMDPAGNVQRQYLYDTPTNMRNRCIVWAMLLWGHATAQPYLDIISAKGMINLPSARKGGGSFNATSYINLGLDLPVVRSKHVVVLFSPYADQWNVTMSHPLGMTFALAQLQQVSSYALPLTVLVNFKDTNNSISLTFIERWNGEADIFKQGRRGFQSGVAAVYNKRVNKDLQWKAGLYYNKEFFGNFFMPLAGIDWRIDGRNNLFGLLPGRLTYEHKTAGWLYCGATFRAFTNSYQLDDAGMIRIDDNQLSAFADVYPSKDICVTLESGLSLFRSFRSSAGWNKNYDSQYKVPVSLFFKLSAAYRLRFR